MRFKFRKSSSFILLAILIITCLIFYLHIQNLNLYENIHINKLLLIDIERTKFNINQNILAFLHIQKTGGSDFDRNIVKHLLIKNQNAWNKACTYIKNKTTKSIKTTNKFKKFACLKDNINQQVANDTNNWYFSRQTFGWICGLHPGMTELKECVEKIYPLIHPNKILYFTILREPVKRFLSEWKHVSRGATWKRKNSKKCASTEYERCLKKGVKTWTNVTIDEFLACKYNPAFNRQTKMLAYYDSQISRCTYDKINDLELLTRAKKTLKSLVYFALNEYQNYSKILFESSFDYGLFKFDRNFQQLNNSIAEKVLKEVSNHEFYIDRIKETNHLDVQLYQYALKLFFERLKFHRII